MYYGLWKQKEPDSDHSTSQRHQQWAAALSKESYWPLLSTTFLCQWDWHASYIGNLEFLSFTTLWTHSSHCWDPPCTPTFSLNITTFLQYCLSEEMSWGWYWMLRKQAEVKSDEFWFECKETFLSLVIKFYDGIRYWDVIFFPVP